MTHSFLGLPRNNTWKILKTIGNFLNFYRRQKTIFTRTVCLEDDILPATRGPSPSPVADAQSPSRATQTDTHCSAVPPGTHHHPVLLCQHAEEHFISVHIISVMYISVHLHYS